MKNPFIKGTKYSFDAREVFLVTTDTKAVILGMKGTQQHIKINVASDEEALRQYNEITEAIHQYWSSWEIYQRNKA